MKRCNIALVEQGSEQRASLWVLVSLVVAIKASLWALDPSPKFFFGDSYCYLETAKTGWIPPDRSFTYGYFIRATLLLEESLRPLMAIQWVMGVGCAVGLGYISSKYLGARPLRVYLLAALCSLEPLQLCWERAIMTETLSLFLMVLYLWACLEYLRGARISAMVLLQVLGTALVSVRLSYLPLVGCASLALPFMAEIQDRGKRGDMRRPGGSRNWWLRGVHLLLSMGLMWAMHGAYKWSYARLSGFPAGYSGASGYILLATWAPVVEARDFPDQELGRRLLESLSFEPKDRRFRNDQLFSYGGLVQRIRDGMVEEEGDRFARFAALRALERDPLGVLKLGLMTLWDFFDLDYLRQMVLEDLGYHQEDEYRNFREAFQGRGFTLPEKQPITWSKAYYALAIPWYLALLATPLWGLLVPLRSPVGSRGARALLLLASVCFLGVVSVLAVQPVVRYLHPMAWLALGVAASHGGIPRKRPLG